MTRYAIVLVLVHGLAACAPTVVTPPAPVVADTYVAPTSEVSRRAELTLRTIAQAQYPGQDAKVIGNCAILNADVEEIEALASPNSPVTSATATRVFAKPNTQACMTRNGITL